MGSIVGIAAAAGLAYWAYSTGLLSSLFGTTSTTGGTPDAAATAAAQAAAAAAAATAKTNSDAAAAAATKAAADAAAAAAAAANAGPGHCPLTGVLAPALALAQKQQGWADPNDPASVLTMDQWNYFLNQVCTGLSAQVGDKLDAGQIWANDPNRGGPINWLAYKGYATAAGLSGPRRLAGSGMGTRLVRKGVACC